mgnify:CR=1 FL=1
MILEVPQPNNPLSINRANSMHWATKKRILDPWREAVSQTWMIQGDRSIVGKPCEVTIGLWFRTLHRRDPHNYTGTVVKTIIDTLVRVGVWPDDTPEWVTVKDPVILLPNDGNRAHYCIIKLEER